MTEHRCETRIDQPIERVAEMLRARPATWMRSFLRLATIQDAARRPVGTSDERPWYRIGTPFDAGPAAVAAPFTWWPHLGDDVFTCFHGELRARPVADEAADGVDAAAALLEVEGSASGGRPERNDAVLCALVRLMAQAIDAAHPFAE